MNKQAKTIDLILVNSFAPRQRIASDAALENGLAVIRTYLEDRHFAVYVADEQRVSAVEDGVPTWLSAMLRSLVKLQAKPLINRYKLLLVLFMLLTWPLQSLALACRQNYMDKVIDRLIDLAAAEQVPFVGIKVWGGAPFAKREISPRKLITGLHCEVWKNPVSLPYGLKTGFSYPC
jgi:hypothetical protein